MILFKTILILHILAGTTGLLLGTAVLFRKKGDKMHKKIGKIFTIAMISTGLLAFILSYLHPNLLLFIVGVFTIYLTATGNRMIALKVINKEQKPKIVDYLLTFFMLIASFSFLYFGTTKWISGNSFGFVLCLFGGISLSLCYMDIKRLMGKSNNNLAWLKNHIGRMIGAYIAAFTAFLVVNNTLLPNVVAWSLPTIIGVFFILKSIREIKSKQLDT